MQTVNNAQSLEQAFAAFNAHSAQLEDAYGKLREQVDVLTRELAAARSERLRQLREKERLASRLERLLDALPGGVLVLDGAGAITQCNPVAVEILGEPLLGRRWRDVIDRAQATDAHGELEFENGRRVSVARRDLVAEPGQIILLSDVTETRRLQTLVERNQRLSEMGEMAARLAHQIRTPLSSAMLYASHQRRPALPAEKRGRYADNTVARLQQIERMVGDMLTFARGGRGGEAQFDVGRLLAEAGQMLEPQLTDGDRILIEDGASIGAARGNYEALLGALGNLAANALEAGDGNACVRLSAHRSADDEVCLVVADDGPGMGPEVVARIFEPFFTTRPGGTGLGLAVVRSTARAHGGDVDVYSAPGGGTRFVLRLGQSEVDAALPGGRAELAAPLAMAG